MRRLLNCDYNAEQCDVGLLKRLQNVLSELRKSCGDLQCKHDDITKECKEYNKKQDVKNTLDHQFQHILQCLNANTLPKKFYYRLMQSVLKK